jgi:ATP-dependent Zn protease
MTQAHEQTRSVLTEHREALDRLAQALLHEEILKREQVLAIVQGEQNTRGGAGDEQASQKTSIAGN